MAKKYVQFHTHGTNVRTTLMAQRMLRGALVFLWNYFPALSKIIVKKMFFTPVPYRVTAAEKAYLDHGEAFEIRVHEKAIQCWKWGRGPNILLVHGWSGRGIQFRYLIESLVRAGYSVTVFDAPGHGESEGKTSSYFEFTDTIRAFLGAGNGHQIQGVVAHSLGASAVLNGLVKENLAMDVVLIAPALRLAELFCHTLNNYGVPEPLYQHLIKELEDQFGYHMHRDNPYHIVKDIRSRILIVHDKDDMTIPYVDSKEVSERLENVLLYTTQALGHKRILIDHTVKDVIADYFQREDDGRIHPS